MQISTTPAPVIQHVITPLQADDIATIQASNLFDSEWYLAQYQDVANSGLNPVIHYVSYGADEGRLPFKTFNPNKYLKSLPYGTKPTRNVLAHYILSRAEAEREAHVISDIDARALFSLRARNLRPLFARRRLTFQLGYEPDISVIMVMHNQFDLTLAALDSLHANYSRNIDLILVDSGSEDLSRNIERYVMGARIIRFNSNVGFVQACNAAIPLAKAPKTLFLNNDVILESGAIEAALCRFRNTPDVGAVGGKVLRANGTLQEAGSIVWRDGTTEGYLRDCDANLPEANFVREVDFCSGVFLAVETKLLQSLGGLDERFKPAYFEDTDICLRISAAGHKIIYDPAIVLTHREHSSSDQASAATMMTHNRAVFIQKYRELLSKKFPRHPDLALHAASGAPEAKKILFIEDRLPLRHLGSGYTRSNDIVTIMASLGYQLTIFPLEPNTDSLLDIYRDFPDTVEVIHDRELMHLGDFLLRRSGYFDIVWIARTHNAARLTEIIAAAKHHLPFERIILDTEALATSRDIQRAALQTTPNWQTDFTACIDRELAPAAFCQRVVAVNELEARTIRDAGYENVEVLGHQLVLHPTRLAFEKRRDLLFIGAIHEPDSPNLDGLHWFASYVLPLLNAALPVPVGLSIVGYVDQKIDLSILGQYPRITLLGRVDNLEPLYNSHRVFVAPTRYAAGISFKVHEAASFGLPIVTSNLLCKQLGWQNGEELLSADTAQPETFAAQIQRAYTDRDLWSSLRQRALAKLEAENGPERYRADIGRILRKLDVKMLKG